LTYLLDTNSWVAVLRWQNAGILSHLKQYPPDDIVLCSVVLAELWFGAERSDPARQANNRKLVDELEAKYQSFAFDNAAAREYALIRAHLSNAGQLIGPNDMLIAAIARSRGATLITHNTAEFRRVPGLIMDNWLAP
jgi:tRNA(fMet)-specific endonuclease VapC